MMRELTPEEIKQRKAERDAIEIPYRNARIREMIINMLMSALVGILLAILCKL